MGPAYSVPHLSLSIEEQACISIMADLIVRGAVPIGTGDYVDRFYGPDVISWYDKSAMLEKYWHRPRHSQQDYFKVQWRSQLVSCPWIQPQIATEVHPCTHSHTHV